MTGRIDNGNTHSLKILTYFAFAFSSKTLALLILIKWENIENAGE